MFLVQQTHWTPQQLAWVLAIPGVAGLFLQVPVGFLYDRVWNKRYLVALGAGLLAAAAIGISRAPGLVYMCALQLVVGLAMNLLSVGIPAMAFGASGARALGARLARNEVFSKIGNFSVLGITGFLTHYYSLHWMFGVVCVASMLVIASSLFVAPSAPVVSRREFSLRGVFDDRRFVALLLVTFLFEFANGSMFMIFEQAYTRGRANAGVGFVSTLLFLTQVLITVGTLTLARRRNQPVRWFAYGFAMIALRGLVFVAPLGSAAPVLAQILDGLIASIILVVPMRTVAEIAPTNFNVRQGLLGTSVSLAYSASTVGAGYLIAGLGHAGAYLTFAVCGAVGLLVTLVYMRSALSVVPASSVAHLRTIVSRNRSRAARSSPAVASIPSCT